MHHWFLQVRWFQRKLPKIRKAHQWNTIVMANWDDQLERRIRNNTRCGSERRIQIKTDRKRLKKFTGLLALVVIVVISKLQHFLPQNGFISTQLACNLPLDTLFFSFLWRVKKLNHRRSSLLIDKPCCPLRPPKN